MAGIRKSARLERVVAKCGHYVDAYIPPGELGKVGRRNIQAARENPCQGCAGKKVVAMLPTGDWSVVDPDAPVVFYEMTDAELDEFESNGLLFNMDIAGFYTDLGRTIGRYTPNGGFQQEG